MKFLRNLLYFAFLTLAAVAGAQGLPPPSWLQIQEKEITPSQEIFQNWVGDIYQSSEVWIVKYPKAFDQLLARAGAGEALRGELFATITATPKDELSGSVWSFYQRPRDEVYGVMNLSKELKARIPVSVLQAVYTEQFQRGFGPIALSAPNRLGVFTQLAQMDLPREIHQRLIDTMVHVGTTFRVAITPEIWPHLPLGIRRKFVTEKVGAFKPGRLGLSVHVQISPSSPLEEIARTLNPQAPGTVLEKLKAALLSAQGGEVKIPLQDLLTPFIQNFVDRFNSYGGPNCMNCALNAHRGDDFFLSYELEEDAAEVLQSEYEILDASRKAQAGDLLFYYNGRGEWVHSAVLITDEIVFTKNGFSKFKPYQFQWRSSMERVYFPDNGFRLKVFRVKPKSPTCTQALTSSH